MIMGDTGHSTAAPLNNVTGHKRLKTLAYRGYVRSHTGVLRHQTPKVSQQKQTINGIEAGCG